MQFTIEARELTGGSVGRLYSDRSRHTIVEAQSPDEAISQFLLQNGSELVSVVRPGRGAESIATVKQNNSLFLVRVYSA